MSGKRIVSLAALAVVGLAACGGESTGPDTEGLSGDEAEALSSVIISQALQSGFSALGGGLGTSAPQLVPIYESLDALVSCPLGGSVSVAGGLEGEYELSGAGSLSMDVTMVHQSCRLQDPPTGYVFTIDGAPDLTSTMDMQIRSDLSASFTGGNNGVVAWDLDGRTGSCALSIMWTGSVGADGTTDVSVSGTVCGDSI